MNIQLLDGMRKNKKMPLFYFILQEKHICKMNMLGLYIKDNVNRSMLMPVSTFSGDTVIKIP